jgi:hypothetical protein
MSITFDTERWSNQSHAWDLEQLRVRGKSPRVVSIGDSPLLKAKADIQGAALFRQFTGENEMTTRIIRIIDTPEDGSER